MNNILSVIIPFLNEGEEVENTIKEIKKTAGDNVDIILVNDASNDNYNYNIIAKKYNTIYIEHKSRLGSGMAKQDGINACKTPFFLVIDAHMRFYNDDWWRKIPEYVKSDKHAIYCCRCKPWSADTKQEMNIKAHYGAYLDIFSFSDFDIMKLKWIKQDIDIGLNITNIPCVLGACYAATKDYWNYIKGYEGLTKYGCEEIYVSMKTWMEGGTCKIIKDITIGHLFRKQFPYDVAKYEDLINKMFIVDLLFPIELKTKIFNIIKLNFMAYNKYKKYSLQNKNKIDELKKYILKILPYNSFYRFYKFNNNIKLLCQK